MLNLIRLEKDKLPFEVSMPFDKFQTHYIVAKKNADKTALSLVYQELIPTFRHWQELFETHSYYTDITVYTLLRLLQADDKTPGTFENKINLLTQYFEVFQISFFDVCSEAFLLHMKKKSYIPMYRYSKKKDLYYYIAKEIKMFIFSSVRKMINYQNKTHKIKQIKFPQDASYCESYLNLKPLQNFSEAELANYLHYALCGNFPLKTNINYTSTQEETTCQLTKMLLSSN